MNITKMKEAGILYDEGLKRLGNKPEKYMKYLQQFFTDPLFEELEHNIEKKNYEEAFRDAHALKGMAGNLSMHLFYEKISVVVEALRHHETEGIESMFEQVQIVYRKAKEAVMQGGENHE